MKKTSKKKSEIKKGEVCVPCRFPDSSALLQCSLKTGVKAGGDPPDGGTPSPGTCPPGKVQRVM